MDVQASAINAYVFCPRRCYYEYIEQVFYHNVYTLHGKLLHEHVDHAGSEQRDDRLLYRSLYLYSERYRLSVRCDVVEERDGMMYPVEYKRGMRSTWENNYMQLCAQALALEEYTGKAIEKGYIYFYGSRTREEVEMTMSLRQKTEEVIEAIRSLASETSPPAGINDVKRCPKCSLVDYCMPELTNILKGKIVWERYI